MKRVPIVQRHAASCAPSHDLVSQLAPHLRTRADYALLPHELLSYTYVHMSPSLLRFIQKCMLA